MPVVAVTATDADYGSSNCSVSYTLRDVPRLNNQPLFSIDAHTGLISTMQSNALDREVESEYKIIVVARDRGYPPISCK